MGTSLFLKVPHLPSNNWDEIPELIAPGDASMRDENTTSYLKVPRNFEIKFAADANQDTSAIHLYLNDIGKFARITAEEEIKLARKIQKGDEKAKEKMIRANLRLVVKIAQDYSNLGLPILDLIAEGNMGLIKAIERFDPTKGTKLSTYASWWIKQYIKRALSTQAKTIRLPIHLIERLTKIRRAAHRLEEKLGREATDQEIADVLKLPVEKVAHLKTVAITPASLEEPAQQDSGMEVLGNFIPDERIIDPALTLAQKTTSEELRLLLKKLSDREIYILKLRFGIDGHTPATLEEIGQTLGLTRERVRQMQEDALFKLKQQLIAQEASFQPIIPIEEPGRLDPLLAFFRNKGYSPAHYDPQP